MDYCTDSLVLKAFDWLNTVIATHGYFLAVIGCVVLIVLTFIYLLSDDSQETE